MTSEGPWFHKISHAQELEQTQWNRYEQGFLQFHENVLVFRYLPTTADERSLVEKYYPEIRLEAAKGRPVTFDCEKITFEQWEAPVYYSEIRNMTTEREWGKPWLNLTVERNGSCDVWTLPLSQKENAQRRLFEVLQNYFGRYTAAAEY